MSKYHKVSEDWLSLLLELALDAERELKKMEPQKELLSISVLIGHSKSSKYFLNEK